MTVFELIEILKTHDGHRLVVMAKDSEGNSYSPLSDAEAAKYRAETTWYGDVGLETLTSELKSIGFTSDDVMEDGEPALVLRPIN